MTNDERPSAFQRTGPATKERSAIETTITADETVTNGIAVLDELPPPRSARVRAVRGQEWRPLIDKTRLWLPSASRCVLGQVFGYYDDGVFALGLATIRETVWCGFAEGAQEGDPTYAGLDDAWRRALPRWVPPEHAEGGGRR